VVIVFGIADDAEAVLARQLRRRKTQLPAYRPIAEKIEFAAASTGTRRFWIERERRAAGKEHLPYQSFAGGQCEISDISDFRPV
jgi:hypothetical protein